MTDIWQFLIDPFHYQFMVRALFVSMLVGVVCAVLSCFVTLRGEALLGDAISHAILPGVALAYLFGVSYSVGALFSGLSVMFVIGWLQRQTRLRSDAIIGIVFTAYFGLGLIIVSMTPRLSDSISAKWGFRPELVDINSILFGNVLGIDDRDAIQAFIIGTITIVLIVMFRRDLVLFSFDPNHARAIGLNVGRLSVLFYVLLALTIIVSLQTIGIVLVIAMLVTPGAIGYMLTNHFDRMLLLAIASSVWSCISGVYASYYLNVSTGGSVVFVQSLIFLVVVVVAPKRGLLAQARQRRELRQQLLATTGHHRLPQQRGTM